MDPIAVGDTFQWCFGPYCRIVFVSSRSGHAGYLPAERVWNNGHADILPRVGADMTTVRIQHFVDDLRYGVLTRVPASTPWNRL
jgi:hypothetical protein